MENQPMPRAAWFPNTVLSPEFAEGTVPMINNVEDALWEVRRTPAYQGSDWMTVIADRGFTEGTHYFEIRIVRACRFMVSLLFPTDESLINEANLASHPGAGGNPLLSQNYTAFFSGTGSVARNVRNIHDMKIDDNMTPYRDALLASGVSRDFFNAIVEDPHQVCAVRDHRDIVQVQQFVNGQRAWGGTINHLQRHGRNFTYPHPVWDWAGCRVGFLMDLDRGRLYLLVYFAGNQSTSYDEADKRVLFAVLGRGRRYFPAISLAGCEGALELRTSTELPAGYGDVAGQLAEARAQVAASRQAMAAMEARLAKQEAELRALRAQRG